MLDFPYIIKNSSRAKGLRIVINSRGEVVLTKPKFVPNFIAKQFLLSKQKWVLDSLDKISQKSISKDQIFYRGKLYQLDFKQGKSKIIIKHPKIFIYSPEKNIGLRQLTYFLKKQAEIKILDSLVKNSQRMQLEYRQVRFRDQKTRWGSCSSQKNLNFNWRLIMSPPEVLDYVVIHELAHLKHHDHSKAFWQLVENFDPDYREHRRWLNRNQQNLIF